MKSIPAIMIPAIIILLCGWALGAGEDRQMRVSLQYFEMPASVLAELLAGDKPDKRLHERVMEQVRGKNAVLLETCIGVCRSGEKASVESIREEIYPTAWCVPPPVPCSFGTSKILNSLSERAVYAFETRDTGVKLGWEGSVTPDGRCVELRLSPEIVSRVRLDTMATHNDRWGDASIRMPVYKALRTLTSLTVESGRFILVSVMNPLHVPPALQVDSKVLLFVRADVMETP